MKNNKKTSLILFLTGAALGLMAFGLIFGFNVINPFDSSWIWHAVTHDTAQHFLGWEFARSAGGPIVDLLAYPHGLSLVFMDVIPLLALPFGWLADWLPDGFQYFGLWAVACYMLMGGFGAIITHKLCQLVDRRGRIGRYWRIIFAVSGSLIMIVSPVVLARTLYHPALAGQWLILWGIWLILNAKTYSFARQLLSWVAVLVASILIHPYFLPMMTAMCLIATIIWVPTVRCRDWRWWVKTGGTSIVPVVSALVVFTLIGGFSIGSGAEIYDLDDKGFNLLSFFNSAGYSIIPAIPTRSSSPETMMWLGRGVLVGLLAVVIGAMIYHRQFTTGLRRLWARYGVKLDLIIVVLVALTIFAMGTTIDLGPITLLYYSVPDKILEIWNAFRASAREAWPLYYGLIFIVLAGLMWLIKRLVADRRTGVSVFLVLMIVPAIGLYQVYDIITSPKFNAKHDGFMAISGQTEDFQPLNIDRLATGRKHLVALDENFRGDQSGTYILGRTALKYDLSLNSGFFARLPAAVKADQAQWRQIVTNHDDGQISLAGELKGEQDLSSYLLFTADDKLASKINTRQWQVQKIGRWWFVTKH